MGGGKCFFSFGPLRYFANIAIKKMSMNWTDISSFETGVALIDVLESMRFNDSKNIEIKLLNSPFIIVF